MEGIAKLPKPPYYAVIFVARLSKTYDGYDQMAERMESLGMQQPGFLGIESVAQGDGLEITISYWRDEDSIRNWRENLEHKRGPTARPRKMVRRAADPRGAG